MKREIDYQWRLSELMARRGLHNSTDLAPLLRERGVDLSPSQVYRIVTQRPERISLTFLAALPETDRQDPRPLARRCHLRDLRRTTCTGNVAVAADSPSV
jgi:hypothetical protein